MAEWLESLSLTIVQGIFVLAAAVAAPIATFFLGRRPARANSKLLSDVTKLAHNGAELLRDLNGIILGTDFTSELERVESVEGSRRHLARLLDGLVRFFEQHVTHQTTSACIKLVGPADDLRQMAILRIVPEDAGKDPYVLSLVRDYSSTARGREEQRAYRADQCTAFSQLMQTGSRIYCPSEDLLQMAEEDRYRNPTPDFHLKYRSCMVIPIRRGHRTDETQDPDVIGFLALDCKSPGAFGSLGLSDGGAQHHGPWPPAKDFAASLADSLYWPLKVLTSGAKDQLPPSPYTKAAETHEATSTN